jgi:hypothetical protein
MQATDIMVYIHECLNINQKQEIESQLREIEGVIAPRFNKEHILIVYYNIDKINSSIVLNFVRAKGYKANLVGM